MTPSELSQRLEQMAHAREQELLEYAADGVPPSATGQCREDIAVLRFAAQAVGVAAMLLESSYGARGLDPWAARVAATDLFVNRVVRYTGHGMTAPEAERKA